MKKLLLKGDLYWLVVLRSSWHRTGPVFNFNQFQWPRGLRRVSSAAGLLGLRVRITPNAWITVVSVVCCEVEVPTTDWSLVQDSATKCGVSECDCENSIMMRPQPEDGPKHQRMKAV
jgi:hypothetical protein